MAGEVNQFTPVSDAEPLVSSKGIRLSVDADTHNLFAVFIECCLNKECSQSKAQSIVSVPNTGLPTWGTGLQ